MEPDAAAPAWGARPASPGDESSARWLRQAARWRPVVELATRAPSVHNSQPWRWLASDDTLELYADRTRQLAVADPLGRNLLISCGAALHHAQVVAEALGWRTHVDRFPDPAQPDLLARIRVWPAPPSRDSAAVLDAVASRRTDRRRFTSWPIPDHQLTHLAAHATAVEARAEPVTEVARRFRAEMLINEAIDLQAHDERAVAEQRQWIDHGAGDGIPVRALPHSSEVPVDRPSRFVSGIYEDMGSPEVQLSNGLIVMYGPADIPSVWLRTGEGLSNLWLAATREGLSVVPLSQVVEVAAVREAFGHEVLDGRGSPMIVLRIGWQPIGRSDLGRTPRRDVDEVLHHPDE